MDITTVLPFRNDYYQRWLPKDLFIHVSSFCSISDIYKFYNIFSASKEYLKEPYVKQIIENNLKHKYNDSPNKNLINCIKNEDYHLVNYFIKKVLTIGIQQ